MSLSHQYNRGIDELAEELAAEGAVNPKEAQAARDAKAPLDYLEPCADEQAAWAMFNGAQKYGRRNYRDTPMKMTTYVGAIRRHVAEWAGGVDTDKDDGLHPLAHIIACCHVMLAAIDEGTAVDDRRDKGSTPRSDRVHIDGDQQAKAAARSARFLSVEAWGALRTRGRNLNLDDMSRPVSAPALIMECTICSAAPGATVCGRAAYKPGSALARDYGGRGCPRGLPGNDTEPEPFVIEASCCCMGRALDKGCLTANGICREVRVA